MKIKYSFNSTASWGGRGKGIVHRQVLLVPRAKSQPLCQAPPLHKLKKIISFPLFYHSGSLSVIPGPRVSASPGDLLEMQITGLTPDPLNQKDGGYIPAICVLTSFLY